MKSSRRVRRSPRNKHIGVSKNTDPSRGCEGKQRFATFRQAQRFAKLARARKKHQRFEPYRCSNCQGFHFGHKILRSRRTHKSYRVNITGEATDEC